MPPPRPRGNPCRRTGGAERGGRQTEEGPRTAAAPAAPAGPAVFPSAVDPKYAKETAGKARMHTCADQWKVNKTANTTGGMKWIEKGGGYWSECNKKLKA